MQLLVHGCVTWPTPSPITWMSAIGRTRPPTSQLDVFISCAWPTGGTILLPFSMMREADLQQALRNHEQAGRAGAIKIFAEEGDWMRQRAQELRLTFQ